MGRPPPQQLALFAVVGLAMVALVMTTRTARQKKERRKARRRQKKASELALSKEGVSARGMRLNQPALPYLAGVIEGFANPYDPATGEGIVLLAVAENKLAWPVLKPRIEKGLSKLPDWVANYGPMEGQAALREPLAKFLETRVVKAPVDPAHLSCATGVGAALSNLFFAICDAGDAVLIPSPYYSAFDSDLRSVCDLKRVPVRLAAEKGYALTRDALDRAYAKHGGRTKALLLTNPHNPLGRVMAPAELRLAVEWCDHRRLHLVCDEIYALSALGSRDGFVSLGEITGGRLGPRRHVLWGLSKDFGMSGLRFGVTWTQNDTLLSALATAAVFTCVPGPCQALVADVLADDAFVDAYLAANSAALDASCAACFAVLDRLRLPYLRPKYGMFLWCDFSSLLPLLLDGGAKHHYAKDALLQAETALYDALRVDLGLVLTPGSAQHASDPGFFRICFAFVELPVLVAALARFEAWVREKRGSS